MGANDAQYQKVTDAVLAAIDRGVVPWVRPWDALGGPRNAQSGRGYRGVNVWTLETARMVHGYTDPRWTTYRAARKSGGHVRKGEKGSPVTFWKFIETEDTETGELIRVPFLRLYVVFNVEQCDGLSLPALEVPEHDADPIPRCEAIIAGMPARPEMTEGGDRAYYRPATDIVNLPERSRFHDPAAYYATAFHELGHATGHESRLGRRGSGEVRIFGDADYSREELVAELTAAYVAHEAGIGTDTVERSAAYIEGWARALRDDPRAIVVAAGKAQHAADWILDRREGPGEDAADSHRGEDREPVALGA